MDHTSSTGLLLHHTAVGLMGSPATEATPLKGVLGTRLSSIVTAVRVMVIITEETRITPAALAQARVATTMTITGVGTGAGVGREAMEVVGVVREAASSAITAVDGTQARTNPRGTTIRAAAAATARRSVHQSSA